MAISVLALASGATTLNDHRLTISGLVTANGKVNYRSGIFPAYDAGVPAGELQTVSAMEATIAPFNAIISGYNAAQGGYLFCSSTPVSITFDPGESAVTRVDQVIARIYDNTYDASGQQIGAVEYLKGNSDGSAAAVPQTAIVLYRVNVPAGVSAGNGGINFPANLTDMRAWTVASGGILPVWGESGRPINPHDGMVISRVDVTPTFLEIYDMGSGEWYPIYGEDSGTWNPSSTWTLPGTWSGTWRRRGNLVVATARIITTGSVTAWPNIGGTNVWTITGLPFSVSSEGGHGASYVSWGNRAGTAYASGTTIYAQVVNPTSTLPPSGTEIRASVSYYTV